MKAALLFGQERLELEVSEDTLFLEMQDMEALADPGRAIEEVLNRPIKSPPLGELAAGKDNACVVISDITRPAPNKVLLPPLLKALEAGGLPREKITILVATGMHRPNLGEELEYMVGRDIMEGYNIVNHYCRRPEVYRKVDEIDGAPIEINTHYLEAGLKILTGLIEPHFYAGYSGGGKAILPGISSFETMKFMHSYQMVDHPNLRNCLLKGNPFHEYVVRVAGLVGVDFILNVVINRERAVAGVFAGHYDHAHLAGCDMVYDHSVVPVEERVDLVITSGGGYPLDSTFYQMSKALIGARDILKPGGTIFLACECREGIGGPEFTHMLRSIGSPQEFFEGYCDPENFVIDQWCAQNIYQALEHAGRIYVYSPGVEKEDLEKMGMVKVENVQNTVSDLRRAYAKAVVIPDGPYVVGMIQ